MIEISLVQHVQPKSVISVIQHYKDNISIIVRLGHGFNCESFVFVIRLSKLYKNLDLNLSANISVISFQI